VTALEEAFSANQSLFTNTNAVMQLISQNYSLVRSILNNETSVQISYDIDAVKQGAGIFVDRSVENQITISNTNQDYNIGTNKGSGTLTQTGSNEITLLSFSNYFKHVNNGNPITLTGDLNIRINDTSSSWKTGQKFRISFGDRIYPGAFFVNVLTDASGAYPLSAPTGSVYSKNIISLDSDFFSGYDYLPVIEIICIDQNNLVFQVDAVGKSLTNNI
jgi:hypothetical protein